MVNMLTSGNVACGSLTGLRS